LKIYQEKTAHTQMWKSTTRVTKKVYNKEKWNNIFWCS